MDSDKSYILCQAQGGINDIMCQIWVCTEYALKYKREIILTHWSYFGASLFDVFDFKDYPVKVHPINTLNYINYTSVEPSDCEKYVELFKDKYKNWGKIAKNITNSTRIFDKSKSYPSTTLLLHDSCGGGKNSILFLEHIQFTQEFKSFFKDKTQTYPPRYNAIHIRNTDIKTNVPKLLNIIEKFTEIPCFIGTDDILLKKYILENYKNTFSCSHDKITNIGDHNLHYMKDKYILELALVDLFTMVFSENTITQVYTLAEEPIISGFSILIDSLKISKELYYSKLE
jgi:hypothetical protein